MEQKSEFDLYKAIAILSAYYVNHPEKIFFHYWHLPYGSHWETVKPYLTLVKTKPPEHIYEKPVSHYAHKADWIRLNILYRDGGIYLDIDTICLSPLEPLMKYDFVMGIQGDSEVRGLCNAIMMAKPNTEFNRQWIKSYESFNQNNWDMYSVQIPWKLSKQYPITILSNDTFFYPLWGPFKQLLLETPINYDCCHRIFSRSYCLHLWDMWNSKYLQQLNSHNKGASLPMYSILYQKFIRNPVTLIMIITDLITVSEQIKSIGSYYKIVAHDSIIQMLIFY